MSNYQKWWDSLPKHTQEYLKNQPVWKDKDVAFFCSVALVVGFVFGYLVR